MPILALFLLLCGAAFAGDTTYSRTESVPKTSTSSSSGASSHSGTADPDEDGGEGYVEVTFGSGGHAKGFMARCMDIDPHVSSFQQVLGLFVLYPLWAGICGAADGIWISHAHLFAGRGEMDDWQEGRWRLGAGFGVGAAWMPGQAGGILPLELDLEATGALSEHLQLRLRTGGFVNLMSPSADYQRYVFVDGQPIGSQLDVMTGYLQKGAVGFADLIRPVGSHGLYLAGGAGAVLRMESIEYVRRSSYARTWESRQEERVQALPAADIAVGRYGGGGGRSFWRFEIRYQAILNRPSRMTSFPGDNAEVTHSLAWQWAWF